MLVSKVERGIVLIWIGGREFLSPNEAMALLPAGEPFEVACEVGGVRLQATWSWGEVVDQIFDSVAEIPCEDGEIELCGAG